jgi:hypothetical protein
MRESPSGTQISNPFESISSPSNVIEFALMNLVVSDPLFAQHTITETYSNIWLIIGLELLQLEK